MKIELVTYIITVKKWWYHLSRRHMEIILPRSNNDIECLLKLLREKSFPHLTIWYWWLPQSCVHPWDVTVFVSVTVWENVEICLIKVLYSSASEWRETKFTASVHQQIHKTAEVPLSQALNMSVSKPIGITLDFTTIYLWFLVRFRYNWML